MKKYYLWGLGVGVALAVINTYFSGLLGTALGAFPLASVLTDCSGEECWGVGMIIGDILFILTSLLVAFIIGRFKTKSEPQVSP